ncbi:MAG: amidophosphoribosyltransferase [Gammaproteobacteria bacterium]|nr:amidophosphoribosyltransferase [Gammaproteobacteria bacterium]
MKEFKIPANEYLAKDARAFYHTPYVRMGNPGNPDYLNHLKNTFNNFSAQLLESAGSALSKVLMEDLPKILHTLNIQNVTVCVVPRSKAEKVYEKNQLLFKATLISVLGKLDGFEDGTDYLCRHIDTKTTHLRNPIQGYVNNGDEPYKGITAQTCRVSPQVKGKDILLVDDIYTPGVNIDEDAIQCLINMGANSVTFYAVGKV